MEDLRLFAVRARALEALVGEVATAQGDGTLTPQDAIDRTKDGRTPADVRALGGWVQGG